MNEVNTTEDQLRSEIAALKRQLEEQKKSGHPGGHQNRRPSTVSLVLIALLLAVLIVVGFFVGYLPRQRREEVLAAESKETGITLPVVNVSRVTRSEANSFLVLPGNIQAVTEAPILSRATGYIRKRYVDIGDRVKSGQVVAEVEAPELDQQILQANAAIDQAKSSVQQAEAAIQQGRANENLARLTAGRMTNLLGRGVISKQDNDNAQAQYAAQQANVEALVKAAAAMRSSVAAAEANLARLNQIKTYQTVRAPFDGVITLRNVDTGALVNEGSTLLFRVAQTGTLRTYINLPQADAESVKVGQHAIVSIAEIPGRKFDGMVTPHLQLARPRDPHAAHRSPGTECGRISHARHVRPGGSHRAAQISAAADPRRHARGAQRRTAGRRGAARWHRPLHPHSHWAAISATAWKCSPAWWRASYSRSTRATKFAKA